MAGKSMASARAQFDTVLLFDPDGNPLPDGSYIERYTLTLIGQDVPNKMYRVDVHVRVDPGDLLNVLNTKLTTACRDAVSAMGLVLASGALTVPAFQKG